jgi:hypothetical protein
MEVPLLEVTGEVRDLCDSTGMTMSAMRGSITTMITPMRMVAVFMT